jgi:hypothetical protein
MQDARAWALQRFLDYGPDALVESTWVYPAVDRVNSIDDGGENPRTMAGQTRRYVN